MIKEYTLYGKYSGYNYTVEICDANSPINSSDEWIMAYCYSNTDFHFLRKDKDVGWTHKKGRWASPTNLDYSGNLIESLDIADLGEYNKKTLLYLKITRSQE